MKSDTLLKQVKLNILIPLTEIFFIKDINCCITDCGKKSLTLV